MTRATVAEVQELIGYDPDTGAIWWKVARSNRINVGFEIKRASSSTGYYHAAINKITYPAHRLAWVVAYGEWPKGVVDHINHDRADNRLSNLRDVSVSKNVLNRSGPQSNKRKAGLLGAFLDKRANTWYAQIRFKNVTRTLGRFTTELEAHTAYMVERTKLLNQKEITP